MRDIKEWTLLIYIAGDNNLSDAGLADIQEMCDEGASNDIYVGVEIDTYGEHTGSIRYEITKPDYSGKAYRTVIERLPEQDSGSPETLRSFAEWGLERYPAKKVLMVVWNHGAGFRAPRRNIGYDDYGSSLSIPDIENAFRNAGLTAENKLQILGFDACLMNMIEIVHHLATQVEYIVGSQQTEPGDGWPYDRLLANAKLLPEAEDLAVSVTEEYLNSYKKAGISDVTQSAVLTKASNQIVDCLHKLGSLLVDIYQDSKNDIRKVRTLAQTFEMADYVDIVHLCSLLHEYVDNRTVMDYAEQTIDAVNKAVVKNASWGKGVKHANGLSVWFPDSRSLYLNNRSNYMSLKCNQTSFGWTNFLDSYHQ